MATVVLTAVGTALGGPIGGAIGGLIGNALDHAVLFRPKDRQGARLSDLQIQTSSYGAQIPKLFGTLRVAGTVIWATDLRENRSRSGGGKGQASVTSYSYSASFAVALSARPIRAVKRIWADGNLLRGTAGDFKTMLGGFRVHGGGDDQPCDPLIASAQGVALTPAHRGIAYAVFEDLALADYGNRIPSLTFEVEADPEAVGIDTIAMALSAGRLRAEDVGAGGGRIDGFAASGADLAGGIGPLVEAFGLALEGGENGAGLSRRETAMAVIDGAMLCRRVNGRAIDPVERSGAGAETIPSVLSLRHHDAARDYQLSMQQVMRPGPGRTESGIELPAVLSSDAARALVLDRLDAAWTGRATMALRCGWQALTLEPGMTVAVADTPGLWRIEEREWEAMALSLRLRRIPGAGGTPPAGVTGGTSIRQVDAPHGPSRLMLADLPRLGEGLASVPQLVVAASGGAGWRSAMLFLQGEGGAVVPAGRSGARAIMGAAEAALSPGSTLLVDEANRLVVTLLGEDMELGPAEPAALAQGANLCLVGRELIQFRDAVRIGPARYRLEGLHRGLRGSEWAMASHAAGDPFLLIETAALRDPLASLGMDGEVGGVVRMMAIGIGDTEPAEADLTLSGEALIPPSPVHLTARPDGGGGWTIGWTRRSRNGWRWSSGGEVPLGEEAERYDVRVLDGAVLIRRDETVATAWTYDAAMVAADSASGHAAGRTIELRQIGTHALGRPARILVMT
ncbi:phage tail protein [Sphingobium sp. AP49]|uniref:phage tail protein n=1 Tax=Sphingobium sp. AP49 TaxID=1144307 RepID=UPI00026EDB13|nr:phage tail protein [Sphingobium sp. AP49]WHO40512.1 phage tail protein [Sphingobium sp. AP49]